MKNFKEINRTFTVKKTKFLNQAKWLMAIVAMFTLNVPVWGEEILLFGETFGTGNGSSARDWSMDYKDQSGVTAVYSGASYTVEHAKQTRSSTDAALNSTTNNTECTLVIGPLNVSTYESLKVTFYWQAGSTAGKTYYAKLYYATSSSGEYTEISKTSGSNATTWQLQTFSTIPVAAQVSTLYLKVAWLSENVNTMIDDFKLYGTEVSNYTLTYNANGKDGGGAAPTDANSPYAPSSTVTVLGNTNSMTRTGCTFGGWNTAADGGGTSYTAGNTFTISANTTLYAKWLATVTWVVDGVTVRTDADLIIPAAGKSVTPPSAPSPASNCGDKFMGWTTTNIGADGLDKTDDAAAITALNLFTGSKTVTGNTTFYAVFADYAE